MVRRRIRGSFAGEHQHGDDAPVEWNSDIEVDANTDDEYLKLVASERSIEFRNARIAMTAAFVVAELTRQRQASAYANRTIDSRFKEKVKPTHTPTGMRIPSGYEMCPSCWEGLTDKNDCDVCDAASIVRIKDDDEDQTIDEFYDDV